MKKTLLKSMTFLLILILSSTVYTLAKNHKNHFVILVNLNEENLYLIDNYSKKIVKRYPVATGKTSTPSPIGTWVINSKSKWSGGFGTRWLGLNVPWGKYGIHGTNKPGSIGSAASHGCIRMFNKDIEDLYKYINYGTIVIIEGGPYGPFGNGFRKIEPGYRGSDVYAIQQIMKNKGYYPGYIDGIYGEGMKEYVLKFRKDNKLKKTHNINYEFYKALGIELFE